MPSNIDFSAFQRCYSSLDWSFELTSVHFIRRHLSGPSSFFQGFPLYLSWRQNWEKCVCVCVRAASTVSSLSLLLVPLRGEMKGNSKMTGSEWERLMITIKNVDMLRISNIQVGEKEELTVLHTCNWKTISQNVIGDFYTLTIWRRRLLLADFIRYNK